jgi:uncharacterized protein (TIGR03086 family)
MTDISTRYRRHADAFAAAINAVEPDQWSSPSPCPDWTARDIVGHIVESHGLFLGFVGRELGDIPSVDDDPAAAFAAASDTVATDLEEPTRADATFQGELGETTFAKAVDRFLTGDLLIHRWDLARATGGDETLELADVRRQDELMRGLGDALRGPSAFGPELEAPPGADEQTRLLAFLGRRSW